MSDAPQPPRTQPPPPAPPRAPAPPSASTGTLQLATPPTRPPSTTAKTPRQENPRAAAPRRSPPPPPTPAATGGRTSRRPVRPPPPPSPRPPHLRRPPPPPRRSSAEPGTPPRPHLLPPPAPGSASATSPRPPTAPPACCTVHGGRRHTQPPEPTPGASGAGSAGVQAKPTAGTGQAGCSRLRSTHRLSAPRVRPRPRGHLQQRERAFRSSRSTCGWLRRTCGSGGAALDKRLYLRRRSAQLLGTAELTRPRPSDSSTGKPGSPARPDQVPRVAPGWTTGCGLPGRSRWWERRPA